MTSLWASYKNYFYILLFVLISSFITWVPFIQQLSSLGIHIPHTDTGIIYRNYDGLLYVVAAKAWYLPSAISGLQLEGGLKPEYFAAHLPLYPALIKSFSVGLGYLKSMMTVSVLSTVILGWFFYFILTKHKLTSKPLILTFVMLMLPRFLVVRSVGSPESLFMVLILASLYFFEKRSLVWTGLFGGLATMTKVPGILLFPALVLAMIMRYRELKKFEMGSLWLLLIPTGLLAVCLIYQQQFGNFFAYWHTGYVVPMPYPFAAFSPTAQWVGTHWLEEIVLYMFIYVVTVIYAFQHKLKSLFYFSLVFLIGLIFVQHRDISRYALPLWPITCIVFERFLTSKKVLLGIIIILPAIYLYAWGFLQGNSMPVSNWAPFL